MQLIEATAAPVFELPGVAFAAVASPSRGSAELCTWKVTVAAGLPPTQPHSLDRDEIFMVTAGSVLIGVEGTLVRAGDALVVPAGTSIQMANPGADDAEVCVAIRAGFTATAADGTIIGTPPWANLIARVNVGGIRRRPDRLVNPRAPGQCGPVIGRTRRGILPRSRPRGDPAGGDSVIV